MYMCSCSTCCSKWPLSGGGALASASHGPAARFAVGQSLARRVEEGIAAVAVHPRKKPIVQAPKKRKRKRKML